MNLDELIQALIDLKEEGKIIHHLPVIFSTRHKDHTIDRVKIEKSKIRLYEIKN